MEFKDCVTANDFITFFDDERAFRHTNYYHYTTLNAVNSILESKQIRLTALSKTANDLVEQEIYKALGDNIFSVCFSTGTSESLPLWYLYSGIDGRGARIGLKKSSFIKLIKEAPISLIEIEPEYPFAQIGESITLKKEDYSLLYRDVLYVGNDPQKENKFRCKYNGQVINNIEKNIADSIKEQYKRFVKSLIWFYEKETRVQVEIVNEKLIKPNKTYVVIIDLNNIYSDISIQLAPEFGEIKDELFEEYKGLKDWAYTKLQKSEFAGQLKMSLKEKLCRGCDNNKGV